jgi:hypothetical protein
MSNRAMPLEHSASDEAVGRNIERERPAGKPRKHAMAIALETQPHDGVAQRRAVAGEAKGSWSR